MNINILFIGDIIGRPGIQIVETLLPSLGKKYNADIIIANGENISDGKGCLEEDGKLLLKLNVKVITGGNHTWEKHLSQEYFRKEPRSLRPLNYPIGTYGNGYYIAETTKGKVGIVSLQGRTFMYPIDCPFRKADWITKRIKDETNVLVIDFHAEATAEKMALANYLDGKVSAVIGTHTHVQTSDERIMPKGTGYITDVGMTGPYNSVIGMKIDAGINRFLYQTPQKYQVSDSGNVHICGLFLKVDPETGKTIEIERILLPGFGTKAD